MADTTDIILNELGRQWSQAKQSEDQRATLSNFIIIISVAAQGFIVQNDFPSRAMVVAVFLTLLGIFGAIASAKYYERFRLSMCRVGRLREKLDTLHPDLKLDELEALSDAKHLKRHPRLHRIRLNLLWRLMMFGIVALGLFDIYVIRRHSPPSPAPVSAPAATPIAKASPTPIATPKP